MAVCEATPCCCERWAIPKGATHPLRIDWSPWIASAPGFNGINEIVSVELLDLNTGKMPYPPADPYEIAIVSGYDVPPAYGPPGWATIIDGTIVEVMIEASKTVAVGRNYRLEMVVKANDCNGRRIVSSDCVVITIIECYI